MVGARSYFELMETPLCEDAPPMETDNWCAPGASDAGSAITT